MKGTLIAAVAIAAIAVSGASALASGPQTAERAALLVRVNVTASDTNCVDASTHESQGRLDGSIAACKSWVWVRVDRVLKRRRWGRLLPRCLSLRLT